MAQDKSNKINDATDIVTLQSKDIRNRIISTENDIKHHINDAEMCILEAIEGLGEIIHNMGGVGGGGNCNCDFSFYYDKNEINDMFAESDALSKVTISLYTDISEIFETGETKSPTITLKVNNQGLNPENFTVKIKKGGASSTNILEHSQLDSEKTIYTCTDEITSSQTYYAEVTYTSSNPNRAPKTWTKTCSVSSYFLTYYGFGTSHEDVFENGVSMLVSTSLKNDQDPYEITYEGNGEANFYLLVPYDVEKADINAFKMGGSPTEMEEKPSITHENQYGIEANYTVQKTKAPYENGATIRIYNSNK